MQKNPSSIAVVAEIFFGIGGNYSKGPHYFASIAVDILQILLGGLYRFLREMS